jgi:CRISPR-associated DxTHG motif protein
MSEKKAVITLLGMISHKKVDYVCEENSVKKVLVEIPEEERPQYYFSETLSSFSERLTKEKYINSLHLLVDAFSDRDIIPITTEKAYKVQQETLEFLELDKHCFENKVLINESNYEEIFQKISELLQNDEYDSFIIDLTHGFRHLPILMIVNLIIASIKDIDKIEHIFFAKEISPVKEYEIVDLIEYIGLAKLSFVLESFNDNYTIGNKLVFKNEKYQELVDNLRIISNHILANSLKTLIEEDDNLIVKTIDNLERLRREDRKVESFSMAIDSIIKYFKEMLDLKKEKDYIRLFKFSQMMKERDYLLNSITLLNESVGLYCANMISNISSNIEKHIQDYLEQNNNLYELAHQSKNIIKNMEKFTGDYLFEPNRVSLTSGQKTSLQNRKKRLKNKIPSSVQDEIKKNGLKIELSQLDTKRDRSIKNEIISYLEQQDNSDLIKILIDVERLRNNLAHGNSSEKVDNVKYDISILHKKYKQIMKIG